MWCLIAVVLCIFLGCSSQLEKTFPPWFKFGAATSSYQVEGAWNASDRGEGIWDRLIHSHPENIVDRSNSDVACDSYHNWRRDVQMVHEMGLHFYRFSISWPRLLPNAYPTKISEAGRVYYSDLIDALLEKGIEPIITLYHWDLPQKLQDLGGWTNPLISDWFADYARVVFSLFANRVKTWITINEPNMMCDFSYNLGSLAPGIVEPEMAGLLCNKHALIAHAKAWRIYDEEYKPIYHGRMSIANNLVWMEPKTEEEEDVAEFARQGCIGRYSHPIYSKEGGWPKLIEKAVASYSKEAGYARSKLPAFTKEEILLVQGTYDYYGLNYYTARVARRAKPGEKPGVWFVSGYPEFNITLEVDSRWDVVGHTTAPSYPEGLRKSINWLRREYGDLKILVTENGCSDHEIHDYKRIEYIKQHLEQILLALGDGVNVTGYIYWTLMDNFEWMAGYSYQYGLYEVDFKDPKRTRMPRSSANYLSYIASKRSLDVPVVHSRRKHTAKLNNAVCITQISKLVIVLSILLICSL